MMSDLEFSEEEIRCELENLGYYNVNRDRLSSFKRDLQNLIQLENSSSTSYTSAKDATIEHHNVEPLSAHVGSEQLLDNHFDNTSKEKVKQPISQLHPASGDKENIVTSINSKGQVIKSRPKSSIPFTSIPKDWGASDSHSSQYCSQDTTLDNTTTSASDHSIIKRKVVRKIGGESQIFNESSSIADTDEYLPDSIEDRLASLMLDPSKSYHSSRTNKFEKSSHPFKHYHRRPQSADPGAIYRLSEDYEGPKALIKPMKVQPHERNIKKCDPVSKYKKYQQSWQSQLAPGEKKHKTLRWHVREHMLYHDEVVKKKNPSVYIANNYVVPSDKKRKDLRWQIRMDMAQGVVPPSQFD